MSIRQTLELFQAVLGKLLRDGEVHMGFSKCIDIFCFMLSCLTIFLDGSLIKTGGLVQHVVPGSCLFSVMSQEIYEFLKVMVLSADVDE